MNFSRSECDSFCFKRDDKMEFVGRLSRRHAKIAVSPLREMGNGALAPDITERGQGGMGAKRMGKQREEGVLFVTQICNKSSK